MTRVRLFAWALEFATARGLASCSAGNIAILAAILMPLFIGAAGMATDTVIWTLWKREVQRSADSAAIAGALTIQQDRYQGEKAARHDFRKSKAFKYLQATMVYENSPSDGPFSEDSNAVRITITKKTSLPFSDFFLRSPVVIGANATATLFGGKESCVFALDPSAAPAISFGGSSTLDIDCGVQSNSAANSSISAGGASTVSASVLSAVGGITGRYAGKTRLKPYSPPQPDPLRDVPDPEPPSTCNPMAQSLRGTVTPLTPGCYTGMDLHGNVSLSPGTYYVTGDLLIGANAVVTGSDITIVLVSSRWNSVAPTLTVNGGATLELSAPQHGPYRNLLFYQSRVVAPGNKSYTNVITGNSSSRLAGNLYFPSQDLLFIGNAGVDLGCFKMVARRITMTGNSQVSNNCPAKDERFSLSKVRLVS
ncbi:TadE/TadG family type IV pilus assembly protein [Sphingomonas jeddahensis]|uniref:Putative Flp pilus-assembly TadG-like N-terminal domain-containing protein n=1 Tax=Sphingomonas jeddahensis TaxID=1915074 RepID=A0A1V2EUT2_9SPHN|nr:hypothetical protein SPHI_16820 [Sphingomonas jeddahensis]